ERFAEIARRIEQSLAEIKPESSLLTLGRRFDQLEEHMTTALRNVATRADVEELRIAETQIEEISAQLNQGRRQFARLDATNAHRGNPPAQLPDERLGRVMGGSAGAQAERSEATAAQLGRPAAQLPHNRLSDLISQSVASDLEGLAIATAQKTATR